MTTTLIAWSGGVDSTHALWAALAAGHRVAAHHVRLENEEGRHWAEALAIQRMRRWFDAGGYPVAFSTSLINREGMGWFGWDCVAVAGDLGTAAVNDRGRTGRMPDRWQMGACAEDFENYAWGPAAEGTGARWPHVLAVFAAACWPDRPPEYVDPPPRPKAQLLAELPPDLAALCWACRTPQGPAHAPRPCGTCRSCQHLSEARKNAR